MAMAAPDSGDELRERIRNVLQGQKQDTVTVLSSLLAIQDDLHYLPDEAIEETAAFVKSTINEVWSVGSFYTNFRFTPPGEHTLEVCWGPSCHLRGAPDIIKVVQQELGLEEEGTTPDSRFTWKRSSCAAACAHGPVMILDDRIYGRLTEERTKELMHKVNGGR